MNDILSMLKEALEEKEREKEKFKFPSILESKQKLDEYISTLDDLNIGDYVVLSPKGENKYTGPSKTNNQIGKLIGRGYVMDGSNVINTHIVAVALKNEDDAVKIFSYSRDELEKYEPNVKHLQH